MKRRIRYHGFLIFVLLTAVILTGKFLLASYRNEIIDYLTDIFGMFLVFVGFLLRISARGYKEENSSCGHHLVKDGPYRLLRHPMYFGTFLIGLGVTFIVFKIWVFFFFLTFFAGFYLFSMIKEERRLLLKFEDDFRQYQSVTPMFIPNFKLLLRGNLRNSLPIRMSWGKKEMVSIIGVFIGVFAFEVLEDKIIEGRSWLKEGVLLSMFLVFTFFVTSLGYRKNTYINYSD